MHSNNQRLKAAPPALQPPVTQTASASLPTQYGTYLLHTFEDHRTSIEHVALVLGDVTGHTSILTRVHSECLTGDIFGSQRCDCGEQFKQAQQLIQQQGQGVIIYLRGHEGRGIGLSNKISAYALQEQGLDTVEANQALGLPVDGRDYSIAASILHHLQIYSIRLLSNNPDKSKALMDNGISVEAVLSLEVASHLHNASYLAAKKHKLGHQLSLLSDTNIFS